ncbi:MAG: acyl-CoA thioester hydrolase/BAAT C-terminal domain-containing protein [Phycisphaerae bacterium]
MNKSWYAFGFLALVAMTVRPNLPGQNDRQAQISIVERVLDGDPPGIRCSGVTPGGAVRLHVLRCLEKWQPVGDSWERVPVSLHAWADFRADAHGTVAVDQSTPLRGTYQQADALALLRTGQPATDTALDDVRRPDLPVPTQPSSRVWVHLEIDNAIVASAHFELVGTISELVFETVADGGLQGVFARPKAPGRYPVIISLHGSEGGSTLKATAWAERFASRGFACLAMNYFARSYEGVAGLRTDHVEVPVETIKHARDWLRTRETVQADAIGLHGVSKGAELALLAGSKYDWIRGIVAVVPSDIVWEGYRDGGGTGARRSSWSLEGQPIPYVRLFDFNPSDQGAYRTNTERYTRSRTYFAEQVIEARIRVEDIVGKVLLLASDRDEVWASGDMTRNIVERSALAGASDRVQAVIYPTAGHQISGTGTFPIYLYGQPGSDPTAKDLAAEGRAAADAWRRAIDFFDRTLGKTERSNQAAGAP